MQIHSSTRVVVALILAFFVQQAVHYEARGDDLTPEQIESLRARIKTLKDSLEGHLTSRNKNAGADFLNAAADSRAAVDLYLRCYKEVHFDREELKEADYRAWKEREADRLRDPAFVESIQMQLRYLALSCRAAEVKEIDEIFSSLTAYVDSLSRLEEMPDRILLTSVANSVFSEAYYLEKLLGQNEGWEAVPYNIGGIYDKTILPFLREEKPESLMAAWDRRIEQEKRLVLFLDSQKEKELRGMNRDEQRRARTNQNRQGGVMGAHDKDDFERETLPNMQWSKMKDMYQYVDQLGGAKAMLDFIEQNLTHPKGEDWFREFEGIIGGGGNDSSESDAEAGTGSE